MRPKTPKKGKSGILKAYCARGGPVKYAKQIKLIKEERRKEGKSDEPYRIKLAPIESSERSKRPSTSQSSPPKPGTRADPYQSPGKPKAVVTPSPLELIAPIHSEHSVTSARDDGDIDAAREEREVISEEENRSPDPPAPGESTLEEQPAHDYIQVDQSAVSGGYGEDFEPAGSGANEERVQSARQPGADLVGADEPHAPVGVESSTISGDYGEDFEASGPGANEGSSKFSMSKTGESDGIYDDDDEDFESYTSKQIRQHAEADGEGRQSARPGASATVYGGTDSSRPLSKSLSITPVTPLANSGSVKIKFHGNGDVSDLEDSIS